MMEKQIVFKLEFSKIGTLEVGPQTSLGQVFEKIQQDHNLTEPEYTRGAQLVPEYKTILGKSIFQPGQFANMARLEMTILQLEGERILEFVENRMRIQVFDTTV